jgi:Rps23 Pro-64 3,4-dihydroxylase Tpa1-like proline 4-hydroxylase
MRQNPRIAALKGWVQEQHFSEAMIKQYIAQFQKNTPFPHLLIKDFLQPKQVPFLLNALQKQEFEKKESDLFSFSQTKDLSKSTAFVLSSLHTMFTSSYFFKWLQEISSIPKLKAQVDLHGTCFSPTEHLLPHDDLLDDRKLAYILYLSSLSKKEGGALEFFSVSTDNQPIKVVASYPPIENSFMIFFVSRKSFHQVTEIVADKKRFALGGWFHG